MTFEEAYEKLTKIKDSLENPDTTLDESIKLYEESVKHTKTCLELLNSTEGKIAVIKSEMNSLIEKPLDVSEE